MHVDIDVLHSEYQTTSNTYVVLRGVLNKHPFIFLCSVLFEILKFTDQCLPINISIGGQVHPWQSKSQSGVGTWQSVKSVAFVETSFAGVYAC